jgi:hypothetical protein
MPSRGDSGRQSGGTAADYANVPRIFIGTRHGF